MKHIYSVIERIVSQDNTDSSTIKLIKEIFRFKSMIIDDISFADKTIENNSKDDGFIFNRRNYLFCCSLDNNCLSNWKYYGKGNGYDAYNIKFKAEVMSQNS